MKSNVINIIDYVKNFKPGSHKEVIFWYNIDFNKDKRDKEIIEDYLNEIETAD